jgi:DNA-binding phage protein
VPSDVPEQTVRTKNSAMRIVARKALVQLLEPLVGFVLDSGLSTQDLRAILREAAVRSVAAGQLEVTRRVNISGIAASTGIPRAEISRILKSHPDPSRQVTERRQQSTNRILAVWHQDPKFTSPSGKPADLKIYGRGATFDALVRNHGRGIPTRAMLDELTRAGAAEVLSSQLVRVKTSVAVDRGVTPRAIKSFGERANELLSTMLQNMRNPENPKFIASISGTNISPTMMPLIRRELASKAADFLADLQDSMSRESTNGFAKKHRTRSSRVSVTVFYHETPRTAKPKNETVKKRRNFRRDD